jgi:hypothetical protein
MALSTGAPVGPLQARYDAAGVLLGYFTAGGTEFSGGGGGSASIVLDVLEADLPAASASNDGLEYQITDRRGGCRVKSNGTSWIEQAPAINDVAGTTASTWAARGSGSAVGEIKRITNLGNNPNIFVVWDGTYWQPLGDRVCLYRMTTEITGTGTTTNTSTLPTVTIPASLLNLWGTLEAVLESDTNNTTPVEATWTCNWDGSDYAGTQGANRRLDMRRKWRNKGNAAIQSTITKGNSEAGGAIISNNSSTGDRTKNTANNLDITGSVVYTHATSITGTVKRYEIWWQL